MDSSFVLWENQGITNFKDLFDENIKIFFNFSDLCKKFAISPRNLFRYFQVRDFVRTHCPSFPVLPAVDPHNILFELTHNQKGQISHLYNYILTLDDDSCAQKQRLGWETELETKFGDEWWKEALRRVHTSASCARFKLIQFKVLYRVHYCKTKLAKIYPHIDQTCNWCGGIPANLSHMFWACHKLQSYWISIFKILSKIINVNISPSPFITIFGTPDSSLQLTSRQSQIVAFASLVARRRILLQWKSHKPPSFGSWLTDMMLFLKLEKIKFTLRGSTDKFYSYWKTFIEYFESLSDLPTY